MKLKNFRNATLVALILIVSAYVVSCKKTESTQPDLAANLVGNYKVSAIGNLPGGITATPSSASIAVARNGAALDQVQITATYSLTSLTTNQTLKESKTINLQQSGDNTDLYDGTTKVDYWNKNTLYGNDYPFLTSKISFVASK